MTAWRFLPDPNKREIYVIVEIVCKAIRQHNPSLTNKMLDYINDIYLLANTNEEAVVELDLWDRIHREYYKALQDDNATCG